MGGALTLLYLLKRNPALNGAVVTSPGIAVGGKVPPAKLMLAKVMARLMPSFTLDNGLDLQNLSRDPAVTRAYKEDPLVHSRISARLGLDLLTRGSWIQEHAAEFSIPLLLVQGSEDHIVSPQATASLAKAIPSGVSTYKEWKGFYHETHNEPEKEKVVQFMIDWMNQHLA
jgi:alpha-beta hydrolase superfamily lysophospholipase